MNDFINTLTTRRSIKKYHEAMIPDELIGQVISAGLHAPSGMNSQSTIIVAVTNKETRDKLSELNAKVFGADIDPFYGAPAVLVVLADKATPTRVYDGSLVMGNMLNAAHSLGLGACWIHRAKEVFDSPEGKELLEKWGIKGDYEGIAHCILGYPQASGSPKPTKDGRVIYDK